MSKLIIWGAGRRTMACLERGLFCGHEILAIVESLPQRKWIEKYPVIGPEKIKEYEPFDFVVINNQYYAEILYRLSEMQISSEKIMITDNVREKPFKTYYERAKKILPLICKMSEEVIKQTVKVNERDYSDKDTIYSDSRFHNEEYFFDYYRYRTFEFVAEQIKENSIKGMLAEFGVFRGLFSAVISGKFPDKKIYLFDTFEGFNNVEALKEMEIGNCDETFIESHKDTSEERMLANLPYPENAVVCKGFFPASITEEAEKETYAFVSIDVDFEESTFEGLKFFYPRLEQGGYIFIHDYNAKGLRGVKKAVDRYEQFLGEKLKKVPVADRAGTLIIIK